METVLGRYRNLIILVGVLFLQVLGLAVQVKRGTDAQNTRLIRIWAVDAVTPFERSLMWVQNGSSDLWHNYFYLRGVRAENRELKQQIAKMRLDEVRLNEDAAQAHRLQSLLAFKEQYIVQTVPAQVVGSCGSDLSRCVYIDKGSNDGLAPDMAVITAGGIVGKVLHVYPSTSQVLMINDQSSGVGVLLEKSRLQGVLRGTLNGELMLERVMSDETVAPGETVVSSGGDQIFPKGLPVGTVTSVKPGKEMFLSIKVRSAADLSRVEEVLIVTQKQERAPVVEESGVRVRAADILAQRLPSVPDKPAAAPTPATAGSAGKTSTPPANTSAAKVQSGGSAAPTTAPANKITNGASTPVRRASAPANSATVHADAEHSSTPGGQNHVNTPMSTPSSAPPASAAAPKAPAPQANPPSASADDPH